MWTTLSDKIKDILEANSDIQEVFDYEVDRFDGDPAVIVVPSNNEGDYHTTNLNERIYAFNIRCYISRTHSDKRTADVNMRLLVSSIMDDFDKDHTFSGLVTPAGHTMINVFALPATWGYSGQDDEYRAAEIVVRCRVLVDINLIS